MKDLETQFALAETSYDELVTLSSKFANLVAEHSETDYSHEDSLFDLQELGYVDSEVEEILESSADTQYFSDSNGPDLIEHARILLSNTEEALNRVSAAISPEEYIDREMIHRHQKLYQDLETIQAFLEDSGVEEEAMKIVKSNSERYRRQNYDRVAFEVPEPSSSIAQQEKQKESVN